MNKREFLAELKAGLSGLPQKDMDETLTFYSEMIDDRIEEGLIEEKAVDQIGTVEEVISQIIAEIPLPRLVKEKVRSKRALRKWEIVLLGLGSPIWLSLLIAAVAVIFSLYVVSWSVIISLWAIEISFFACFLGGVASAVISAFGGNGLTGFAMLGAGLVCAGMSILLFFGCKAATRGLMLLSRKIVLETKSQFIGKGDMK